MFSYKNISLSLMTCILCSVPFLTYAAEDSLQVFITQITNLSTNPNPYEVFKTMCSNLDKISTQESTIIYDPKQSLFVTMFCNSLPDLTDDKTEKKVFYSKDRAENGIGFYLKRHTLRDLGFICLPGQGTNNGCITASRASNNDYHYMMTKLMIEIQNEWSNAALAHLYGVHNITESDDALKLSNDIIARRYNAIAQQTIKKDYPKTVKKIEEYIRAGNKLLKKLHIIDLSTVKNAKESFDQERFCPLHALFFSEIDQKTKLNCLSSKEGNNRSYTHLLYNELFFYTLFSSAYEQYLDQFDFGKVSSKANEKIAGLSDLISSDALTIIRNNIASQRQSIIQTTNQTSKALRDFESYFPLHIGMLMYQEDLLDLRGRLTKIYLPLHQLHYKIENVQKAKTT